MIATPTAGDVMRTALNDMNDKGKSVSLIKLIVSNSTSRRPARPLTKCKTVAADGRGFSVNGKSSQRSRQHGASKVVVRVSKTATQSREQ